MVDVFSLKFQRDNRKNALAVDPAREKTGKRLYFPPYCGDETTTYYYNRVFFFGENEVLNDFEAVVWFCQKTGLIY